eukprot:4946772-Amphidinium_carterae.1
MEVVLRDLLGCQNPSKCCYMLHRSVAALVAMNPMEQDSLAKGDKETTILFTTLQKFSSKVRRVPECH